MKGWRNQNIAAAVLFACQVVLLLAGAWLHITSGDPTRTVDLTFYPMFFSYSVVGFLVANKRPRNPVGWILLVGSFFVLLGGFFEASIGVPIENGQDRRVQTFAWIANWSGELGLQIIFLFVFLFFPNGRLPTHRWRIVLWLGFVFLLFRLAASMLAPGPLVIYPQVINPYGIASALWSPLLTAMDIITIPIAIASIASLFARYSRADMVGRLQIRTLFIPCIFLFISLAGDLVTFSFSIGSEPLDGLSFVGLILSVPIAIGIAIQRYRLWDIDLIIRRTVVYTLLTTILAVIYGVCIIFLQQILGTLTGMAGESQFAIVLSTLAITVLFSPLRSGIQAFIDKRFYRRRYNADLILASFSTSLRTEVDIDQLNLHLLEVAQETMKPESVSLWMVKKAS